MALDKQEFERIYRRLFARAMGLAVSLLHNDEDARDVVQEVFTRLWERTITLKGTIDSPDAFVYRSVRNACLNRIDLMTTRERILRTLPIDQAPDESLSNERLESVRQAAQSLLTERESEVIREVFTDGNSYCQAAKALGITTSAINKHIVGALRKLREHFNSDKS